MKKNCGLILTVILFVFCIGICGCGKIHEQIIIKESPDKYTWYIKDYVGKDCASFGYTSISDRRYDEYGYGNIELIFVTEDSEYVDITSDDILKEYIVIEQNLEPNTELKLFYKLKDDGTEYDTRVEYMNYNDIVLKVKKRDEVNSNNKNLTVINASPDKYNRYICDYVGRNLYDCGYITMLGSFKDEYGVATIEFEVVEENGERVKVSEYDELKAYVVIDQDVSPNSELKYEFNKNEYGLDNHNSVKSKNVKTIKLTVKHID